MSVSNLLSAHMGVAFEPCNFNLTNIVTLDTIFTYSDRIAHTLIVLAKWTFGNRFLMAMDGNGLVLQMNRKKFGENFLSK